MKILLNNCIRLLVLLIVLAFSSVYAQVSGFKDDFNNGTIEGWKADHIRTFQLSNENGSLKIHYIRTSESDQWDNFNFTPPQTIDITAKPIITFRIKSDVNTAFAIKPTNGADVPLLTKDIVGDREWHEMSFKIANVNSFLISKMYLYFDGGSTTINEGTVYFDEIAFGDSARFALDYDQLDVAITAGEKLLSNAVEGSEEGEYAVGAIGMLQSAIDAAKQFKALQSEDPDELDEAIWNLYDALVIFETNVNAVAIDLVDDNSTKETRYLYLNLEEIAERSLIFGMHDATGYGVGWDGDNDRSDVKDIVGDYPAMYSEDLSQVQLNNDVEGVRYRLSSAYNRGGIITICWHQYDPQGRGFYDDDVNSERIVSTLLPGGSQHEYYKDLLRNVALFFKSLRGENGESIPVIFRPYHEHTGSWFWWGASHRTTAEYNQIWQFTTEYLRDSLNVHNLLYALSPSFGDVAYNDDYFETYPGDDFVDILGTDKYFSRIPVPASEKQEFLSGLRTIAEHAKQRGKLTALTEVGNENLEISNWFTEILMEPIKNDETARNFSYAAVWRNANTSHHFAPYPGHASVPDFMNFYNDPFTIFESDLPAMYILPTDDLAAPVFLSEFDTTVIFTTNPFTISIDTDERAFLKYSFSNQSYDNMSNEFTTGQGSYKHSTILTGIQGEVETLYIQARDDVGNTTSNPLVITYMVDTLQAIVAWYDVIYPDENWQTGLAPIGTGSDNATITESVRTIYFRKEFDLPDIPGGLALQIKCEGGTAFYLNGIEIARINLPEDSDLDYETDPNSTAEIFQTITLQPEYLELLKLESNNISAEVHMPSGESVGNYDVRMFDDTYTALIDYGAQWMYYDDGQEPPETTVGEITGVNKITLLSPAKFRLYENYPNPFNPATNIRFDIAGKSKVSMRVYDILGRLVVTLLNETKSPGTYEVRFHASSVSQSLASGVYTVILQSGNSVQSQKMLLLK